MLEFANALNGNKRASHRNGYLEVAFMDVVHTQGLGRKPRIRQQYSCGSSLLTNQGGDAHKTGRDAGMLRRDAPPDGVVLIR